MFCSVCHTPLSCARACTVRRSWELHRKGAAARAAKGAEPVIDAPLQGGHRQTSGYPGDRWGRPRRQSLVQQAVCHHATLVTEIAYARRAWTTSGIVDTSLAQVRRNSSFAFDDACHRVQLATGTGGRRDDIDVIQERRQKFPCVRCCNKCIILADCKQCITVLGRGNRPVRRLRLAQFRSSIRRHRTKGMWKCAHRAIGRRAGVEGRLA